MVDMHTHTTYKDSTYTPEELLKEAQQKGLTVISIADHNTVNAYNDLKNKEIRNNFKG